jgi:diguanylate cyclase (GGDEF)-like protein
LVEQVQQGRDWFEIFRLPGLAPGVDALVLNQVTAQREAIGAATRDSILIGVAGLVLSEGLLLLVMRTPLARLRRLARMLPQLAEQQFAELRKGLGSLNTALPLRDEIDLMVSTVSTVAERMETMERDREEARAGLMWLADHDPLTRLLNRRRFNAELSQVVRLAVDRGEQGALLFVDLDQFKDVNDISGHHMGDRLLQRVAEQLETSSRTRGLLGRLGGDEFALILPVADTEQAIGMATRLQQRIQSVIVHSRSWRHQVSASIGIVLFPQHGTDAQQLMADADLAMYQAKEKGRGRWHLFSPKDQGRERANARVLWAERIAAALADNRYELHFQPIMELATGRVWRAEALLRMRDPRGELVLPFSFIPIAEETGQIEAIDHWVLSNAIALMAGHRGLCLSINLSANALQDPSLLPDIERLLATHRINPADLTFEVTETVAINSLRNATRLMRSIQEIGCRFALDDFGSGFASYAYLRQLPVDDVKIDGAFIRDIAYSREDQIFVRAVTEMAHGMGKRVIAEFVENEEIVRVLRDIGVDFAQGYHIGRPAMPIGAAPVATPAQEPQPGEA